MKKYLLLFFIFINYAFSGQTANVNAENGYKNMVKDIFSSTVSIKALKTEFTIQDLNDKKSYLYKENNYSFSTGSGFFINENGTIVTNYHVIENSDKVVITTNDNEELNCDVIGYDKISDIALIKVKTKTKKKFKYVKLKKDVQYNIGDKVFVVGNPYNIGMSMSTGIISGVNRTLQNGSNVFYTNLIQTDATINKGNSGGAIFKENGEFLGMVSVIFSPNGVNIGIGFAIPANDIIDIIEKLNDFGYVQRGWIGIEFGENVSESELKLLNLIKTSGVIITKINEKSPAELSGLRISDIVVSFNDNKITNYADLITLIRNTSVNSDANIVVFRNNELKKLVVSVKEYTEEQDEIDYKEHLKNNVVMFFGSYVIPLNNMLVNKLGTRIKNGLYIIEPSETLQQKGIKSGDIIVSINQNTINSELEANKILQNIKNEKTYLVIINQNGNNKLFILKNKI